MTLNKLTDRIQLPNIVSTVNDIVEELNSGVSIVVDSELNESSVNPVQNAVITSALNLKQDILTAGSGISISEEGVISNTQTSAEWGNISGTLSEQSDLATVLSELQNSIPTVVNVYDSTSSDAMSGIAVASAINNNIGKVFKPSGSIAFESLPSLIEANLGNVYNITNAFTTTTNFVEGEGKDYPAGTNVGIVNIGTAQEPSYKYDVFAGTIDLSSYQTLLTAGANISISDGTISAVDTTYTAGSGITINGNTISTSNANYSYSTTCPTLTPVNGVCTWEVTHNLGTQNISVSLYAENQEVDKNVTIDSNNQITVVFKSSSEVTAGTYKVVVLADGGALTTSGENNQWVYKHVHLISSSSPLTVTGGSKIELNISNYLPDDNFQYEVIVTGIANTQTSSGDFVGFYLSTDVMTYDYSYLLLYGMTNVANKKEIIGNTTSIIIGKDRKLYLKSSDAPSNSGILKEIWLSGYRKVLDATALINNDTVCADRDLSNVSDTAKTRMANMGMPSNTFVDLTLGATGTEYTAPADGYYQLVKVSGGAHRTISFAYHEPDWYNGKGASDHITVQWSYTDDQVLCFLAPVQKGQKGFVYYSASGETSAFRFIYAKGSEHEYVPPVGN